MAEKIDSTFALLDVKRGRVKLAKRINAGETRIPVTIRGYITAINIDAAAEALRQHEQGGRILRAWSDLPNSDRKKWRVKAKIALDAVGAPNLLAALQAVADLKGWNAKSPVSATGIQVMAAIAKATGAA